MTRNSFAASLFQSWTTAALLGTLIVLLALVGVSLARTNPQAVTPTAAGSSAFDQRMIRIADQLQCPVCEGQSVAFSNSQLATEMRRIIEDKLRAGESEEAIIQYFVDRYGVKILREPPRSGFLAWLWLTPVAGFALALIGVLVKLRRMSGQPTADSSPPKETAPTTETQDGEILDPTLRHLVAQYDKDFLG